MDSAKPAKPAWTWVRFGDVVRLNTDRCATPTAEGIERYVGLEHIEPEDLRIRRWGLVAEGTTFTNLFRPGQVLFGKRRAYQRKVAIADFEGVCSSDIYVFEPKDPAVLLPELLPFICQTDGFFEHAVGTSAGSLSPRTNWTQLAAYEFALPPLEERRRIAEVLWALEGLLVSMREAGQSLTQLLTSRVEHFIRNCHTAAYMLPVAELLAEDPRNGFSPPATGSGQGFRTVSISSVANGMFVPEGNIKFAQVAPEHIEQFLVEENDVFVVRGNGNRNLTGKCGLSQKSYADLFYPDLLIRLRFDPSRISPRFAVLEWNAPSVHRRLISRAKSTNGIWKINGKDIRDHTLVVPPIDDQTHFLTEIAQMSETMNVLEARAKDASRMKAVTLNSRMQGKP